MIECVHNWNQTKLSQKHMALPKALININRNGIIILDELFALKTAFAFDKILIAV